MNVLDENIPENRRIQLRAWRVAVRQVGYDLAVKGVKDDAILPLLHALSRPTFFTRDRGFYRRELCHARYALVMLAVEADQVATYVRRLLSHRAFNSQAKRLGTVARVSPTGITVWQLAAEAEQHVNWPR